MCSDSAPDQNCPIVVTSFSRELYQSFAKKMVETFLSFWPETINLYLYHDRFLHIPNELQHERIKLQNLDQMKNLTLYKKEMSKYDGRQESSLYNYRRDALRWSNKVYAITDLCLNRITPYHGWVFWLDADVITKKNIPMDLLHQLMLSETDLIHLGRKDIDYSETSFLGFNLKRSSAKKLIQDLHFTYELREPIAYREWHDAFIFERLLKLHKAHGLISNNLTPTAKGLEVFEQSILGDYMVHLKGNRKKLIHLE